MKTESAFSRRRRAICALPLILCCLLFNAGCRQAIDAPPVIVSKPVCLLTSAHGTFSHAGISFKCHNTANSQLSSLEVSFLVFTDSSGGNPLYGSNTIRAEIPASLAAGDTGTFEVSLDDRLACIPVAPFFIDCFYVRKAVFSDGTEWTDPLGLFYAGSMM